MRKFAQIALIASVASAAMPISQAAEVANLRNGFSIRHERHETVGETTRLYMGHDPGAGYVDVPTAQVESFEPAPAEVVPVAVVTGAPKAQNLKTLVNSASDRTQVDADLIASVIRAESGNNPRALSPKGAQGLMQLMPATAGKLGVKDSFDAVENVDGGVRYLRELLLRYDNDMVKTLAAYNAGPQRVQQYHGVPPYRETHAYVARVINDYNRKKLAERKVATQAPTTARGHSGRKQTAVTSTANAKIASVAQPSTDVAGSE